MATQTRNRTFAYYPGCSQTGTAVEYDMSCRELCRRLGIELREIPDWSCCGASPAHGRGADLQAALAARNVEQARQTGAGEMLTPCPSCLSALKVAGEYASDEEGRKLLSELCGMEMGEPLPARSLLQIIGEEVGAELLETMATTRLSGLRAAPYYGCLLTRPARRMAFDDEEAPTSMDNLLRAAGAEVVEFPFKVDCCGASMGVPRRDMVKRLSGRIVDMAVRCGANAIVVACPLCHQNLDMRQSQLELDTAHSPLPVLYFTQVLGLALGAPPEMLGLDKHFISAGALLSGLALHPEGHVAEGRGR